jgi:hypothetical protein
MANMLWDSIVRYKTERGAMGSKTGYPRLVPTPVPPQKKTLVMGVARKTVPGPGPGRGARKGVGGALGSL